MKRIFFVLLLFPVNNLFSQDCKVVPDSLQGIYTGECKKKLANGFGTAKGVDTYTGNFKNGYPEGKGKYIWKNGSWYDGNWKKGIRNGEGMMHLIGPDSNAGSDLTGFWRDGKYIGIHEQPFTINSTTNKVSDVSFNKANKSGLQDEILIIVKDPNAGASTLTRETTISPAGVVPKQRLTDIQILSGSFSNKIDDEGTSPISNKYKLSGVVYPVHLLLSFGLERVDLEIFEKASWNITVNLEKMRSND